MVGKQSEGRKKQIQHEHTVPITLQIRNQTEGLLPSVTNSGALTRKDDMTNIEEKLKKAQEILDKNPVFEYSLGDLRRMGRTVEEYLSRWPQADQEKHWNYYDDEL